MKRLILVIIFAFILHVFLYSQEDQTNKFKSIYELNEFSFILNSSIYNFNSKYSTHFNDIAKIKPLSLLNTDSIMFHDNNINLIAGIKFNKQLFDKYSSIYGNICINLTYTTGGKIRSIYQNNFHSNTDFFNLNGQNVTNLDTTIVLKNEYIYKSNDFGCEFQYRLSGDPNKTLIFETGIAFGFSIPIIDNITFIDTKSLTVSYTDQYNKYRIFNTLNENIKYLSPSKQIFFKAYFPIILTYKISNNKKFSLVTYFNTGIDIQHPIKGNYYSYPFFSVGIGFTYKL